MIHQFIDRDTGAIRNERMFGDRTVRLVYSTARENLPLVFRALTGPRMSGLLGYLNFDLELGARLAGGSRFVRELGVDLSECVAGAAELDTPRKLFERQIRYWDRRPMPDDPAVICAPADAKALVGSLHQHSMLFIKEKFFSFEELLGERRHWLRAFRDGDFAVFRLTPEKYHYNHCPVSGVVRDIYEVEGDYHSCNPSAIIAVATPFSKNKRVVTVIDTDVEGGSRVGLVAMIEVVALMIGQVVQAYSETRYDDPQPVVPGRFLLRGQPKSLYRPGSSTDVVLFQRGRVRFDDDLVDNLRRADVFSRFSQGFGASLAETEVRVRSSIGRRV